MGTVVVVFFSLALWVILWSLSSTVNLTSFDSILIAGAIILLAAAIRRVSRYLPSRRR